MHMRKHKERMSHKSIVYTELLHVKRIKIQVGGFFNMKLRLRKSVLLASVFALTFGSVLVANASNTGSYGPVYITKTGDYISGGIKKEGTEPASNLVAEIQGNRSLTCWIIDSNGKRVTDKVTYNSADPVYMPYDDPVAEKGSMVRLVISTALTNFTETETWGFWNPDYITTA